MSPVSFPTSPAEASSSAAPASLGRRGTVSGRTSATSADVKGKGKAPMAPMLSMAASAPVPPVEKSIDYDQLDPDLRNISLNLRNPSLEMWKNREFEFRARTPNPFKRYVHNRKPDVRLMQELMRKDEAIRKEIDLLEDCVREAWDKARGAIQKGNAAAARIYTQEVVKRERLSDKALRDLEIVQQWEEDLVTKASTQRLTTAQDRIARNLKALPYDSNSIRENQQALEKLRDASCDANEELGEGNLAATSTESEPEEETTYLMEKLMEKELGVQPAPTAPVAPARQAVRQPLRTAPVGSFPVLGEGEELLEE
ncbi:MAG TPA: hypothetical protein VFH51_13155 [Myxococcota bacterium]|nr:hypothetical protein [Myxococcota bacterium]